MTRFRIPFVRPYIPLGAYDRIRQVLDSGWLTTGPVTEALEQLLQEKTGARAVLCTSSCTAALFLALNWWGIGPEDEVIVPVYTYCATANVVVHCGGRLRLVDVRSADATIDLDRLMEALTPRTRAILCVDVFGMPALYPELMERLQEWGRQKFVPRTERQERLGRPLVIADAAHSLGGWLAGKPVGQWADFTAFSFHAVKNVTSGEGGALCIHLPSPFDNSAIRQELKILALHGQTTDARKKWVEGKWRYDVVAHGWKMNMPDLLAALAYESLRVYEKEILSERKRQFTYYSRVLQEELGGRVCVPLVQDVNPLRESAYHVYALRLVGWRSGQRDALIARLAEDGIQANVHFVPLSGLTAFRRMGFRPEDFPVAWRFFEEEISLPVYPGLTKEEQDYVLERLIHHVRQMG